jgi:hypothetical protein
MINAAHKVFVVYGEASDYDAPEPWGVCAVFSEAGAKEIADKLNALTTLQVEQDANLAKFAATYEAEHPHAGTYFADWKADYDVAAAKWLAENANDDLVKAKVMDEHFGYACNEYAYYEVPVLGPIPPSREVGE